MKLFIILWVFSLSLYAGIPETAISMVPRGRLEEHVGRDVIIKTLAGTKITIGFQRSGDLKEAKGRNLNAGDELEPGEGLISLSSAAQKIPRKDYKGHWILEKDKELGWIYEIDSRIISARSGSMLK